MRAGLDQLDLPVLADADARLRRVEAAGESVREVVASLDAAHPGIAARLQQADSLAPGLAVSIDAGNS